MMHRIAILCCATAILSSGVAPAAPQPSKGTDDWQLKFDYHDLGRIDVLLPGDQVPTAFWYLLYTVTNNTGQDVDYYPSFELVTEQLEVIVGGDQIDPAVFEAIYARHRRRYPFLRDPVKVSGRLLQGEDNARSSVAIFRDFSPKADSVRIYVAGTSGEVIRMPNPSFEPDRRETDANSRFFLLRKTLEIVYDIPGDPVTRDLSQPVRRSQRWIMR